MFFISVQEVGIDKKISIIMQEVRRFNKVLKSSVLWGILFYLICFYGDLNFFLVIGSGVINVVQYIREWH